MQSPFGISSIHLEGDNVKEFKPAFDLTVSNPTRLKLGLCIFSQIPKNSTVFLFLSQLIITNLGSSEFFFFVISVKETYLLGSMSLIPIFTPSTRIILFFTIHHSTPNS